MAPLDPMIRKLTQNSTLDHADIDELSRLPVILKNLRSRYSIVREGDRPYQCCVLISGFCIRTKTTADGKRQILSLHIAGDIPDLHSLHLPVMDHDLATLSDCTVGFISHAAIISLAERRPKVAQVLWRQTLIDASIFREWLLNVGCRTAEHRLIHLIVEFQKRLFSIGLADENSYELPMTQKDLADALGLTPVHINRVLKGLRALGVLEFKRSRVTITDRERLAELIQFNQLYLHDNPNV